MARDNDNQPGTAGNATMPSVLIAMNDADRRAELGRMLGQRYMVRHTGGEAEIVAVIRHDRPDLLLADMPIAGLDGQALLRAVRQDPALADMPVVVVLAQPGGNAAAAAIEAGADDFLAGPFGEAELMARIAASLRRARERRQMRDSEDRFRALVTATSDVVYRMSADWTEMQALDARGILADTTVPRGAWIDDYILPEDRSLVLARIQAAIAARSVFQLEHRVRRADGTTGYVSSRAIPLLSPTGEIVEWFGAASDVTGQIADRDALARSEARYRALFDAIDDGFCIIEFFDGPHGPLSDYIHVEANPGYERQTGIPDIVGRTVRGLAPAEADGWVELYGNVLRNGQTIRFERYFEKVERHIEVSATRVEPASRRQVAVLFRNISARKQAEAAARTLNETLEQRVAARTEELIRAEAQLRQSQKMEAVGQLTGGLAHDFNNLLSGISGALELTAARIAQGRVADVDKFIVAAQGATKRAAALTHRLLAFSRQQTLDPKAINVNKLVVGLLDLIQRTVGPAIQVEMVGGINLWSTLVDPSQLESALLNLCINARDAMPAGGRITIETNNRWIDREGARQLDMQEGQYLSLCVSDTGTGMTPDVMEKAFDPFFTTKPIGQGTGLGLSMIYGFAKQSGGHVRIYSEVGKGTMVCLYLPRHRGEAEDDETETQAAASAPAREGEVVLLVDDEPSVRLLVMDLLEDLGYVAIEASDSIEGLRILQSGARIDLVVSDVGLPGGMNGRQMIDVARVGRPGLKVLFITGFAENALLNNGQLEPGMSVLTKPFAMDVLAARIRDLIAR